MELDSEADNLLVSLSSIHIVIALSPDNLGPYDPRVGLIMSLYVVSGSMTDYTVAKSHVRVMIE